MIDPDFGGGYVTLYVCQNLQNHTFKRMNYCM